jgi:hypothetical protein
MPSMRAARFDRASRNLAVKDVPGPEPAPGEVLVRVKACGICLSDVHLIDGSLPAPLPEVTLGHEARGRHRGGRPGRAGLGAWPARRHGRWSRLLALPQLHWRPPQRVPAA